MFSLPYIPTRFLAGALSVGLLTTTALAQNLDRENATPTPWRWHYGVANSTINASQTAGYRVVSVDVETTSPMRFNAALVRNSGSYARSGRSWWFGSPSLIASKLSGKRMTALTPYVINDKLYLSTALIDNTGGQQKDWRYFYGTRSFVATQVSNFNGRIVDLDSYVLGSTRYYTALAIKNSGGDARSWWYYFNATPSFLASRASANKARITDLGEDGTGRFHAVMVRDPAPVHSWWYANVTATVVADKLGQNGARLVSLQRDGSRFNAVMINNSNALTTKVGQLMRQIPGVTGIRMKQVGGPVLVSINGSRQYEPASSLKTLHHVHAMRQVAVTSLSLQSNITSYQGSRTACPSAAFPKKLEPLEPILKDMMTISHNTRTFSVERYFGRTNLQNTAKALGMSKTFLNHSIGCGTPPNKFTLEDAGKLFEAVANGYLGRHKEDFYRLMSRSKLTSIVDAEAAKLALPANVLASFKTYVDHVSKGGSYGVGGLNHRSHVGWLRLPFCSGSNVVLREYVYGNWINDARTYTDAHKALAAKARECMLEDSIRQALLTWKNSKVVGFAKAFGTGCIGSNGRVTLFATGTPEIAKAHYFRMQNGPKSSAAILFMGGSKTYWGRIRLPLSLHSAGATGCWLYTDPTLSFGTTTTSSGSATRAFVYPNSKSLVGVNFFTQYMGIDKTGNALGLTFSNGLETLIGGWPK